MHYLFLLLKWTVIAAVIGMIFLVVGVLFAFLSHRYIQQKTSSYTYNEVTKIPKNSVGLVLGTSKILANGRINLYFKYRIDAVVKLYEAGKLDYILVSGDNHTSNYNETQDMREALIARGIPEEVIYSDFAGFRTLDSVVRSKEVFGQHQITIISQQFHNERAIYIAQKNGMEAVGFNAQDLPLAWDKKTKIREYFARVKALLDIHIIHKQPKYLGEKISIQ